MMRRPLLTKLLLCTLLLTPVLPATAQEISRDPTVPPGETGTAIPSPTGVEGMTVLVRDEKPYLMVGARLYAPGDKVGNLRVERITEKEVWFHDGAALIKVPRFAGIERKAIAVAASRCAVTPAPVAPVIPAPTKLGKTSAKHKHKPPAAEQPTPPAVAPCEDAQP